MGVVLVHVDGPQNLPFVQSAFAVTMVTDFNIRCSNDTSLVGDLIEGSKILYDGVVWQNSYRIHDTKGLN